MSSALDTSSEVPGRKRRIDWPLLILCTALFALFVAYGRIQRLDYGPDEPMHVEYIHLLAIEHRLPTPEETHVVQHGPVYYALMSPLYWLSGNRVRPMSLAPGPHRLHTFTRSEVRARQFLRGAQSLLAVVNLALAYALLLQFAPGRRWLALWVVACLALIPQYGMNASVVNNDGLANLWCSLTLLAAAPLWAKGRSCSPRRAMLLGLLCGGAFAVKLTACWVVLIAVPLVLVRGRSNWRSPALFAAALIAVGCWWPLHNLRNHGSLFPNYRFDLALQDRYRQVLREDPFELGAWIVFGAANVAATTSILPEWSWSAHAFASRKAVNGAWLAVACCMFFIYMGASLRREHNRWAVSSGAAATCASLVVGYAVYIGFSAVWVDIKLAVGGRYLLTTLPLLALLLMGAAERARSWLSRRAALAFGATIFAAMAAVDAWAFIQVDRWYELVEAASRLAP